MEVELNNTNQYSRRSNVEIRGIPESIQQRDLENHLIDVLHSIGINVESYDIVAVHRIGRIVHGKSRNVITRFINRKNAEKATKNSFKLFTSQNASYKKYFICDNLCPAMHRIFNKLNKYKKNKVVSDVWSLNGHVFMKKNNDARAKAIGHFDDIDKYLDYSDN